MSTWSTIKSPEFSSLDVSVPDFVKGMNQVIATSDLDTIKTYLRWQTLHAAAPMLPKAFVEENFNFYDKTLRGAKELKPRWKRCVAVHRQRPRRSAWPGLRGRGLPAGIEGRHAEDGARTGSRAEAGHHRAFLDERGDQEAGARQAGAHRQQDRLSRTSGATTARSISCAATPWAIRMRANQFEFKRQLNKIGKPVDRQEWGMTPPTVNAYYNPLENNINFPAGILQPPFYDKTADDSTNFGAIGAVIGHELTHGFDDEGSQFDARRQPQATGGRQGLTRALRQAGSTAWSTNTTASPWSTTFTSTAS